MKNTTEIKIYRDLKDRFYRGERVVIKHMGKVEVDITWRYNALSETNELVRTDKIICNTTWDGIIPELGTYFLDY